MDNREAVNWLINISADIGKAEHSDLWHYEQALTEIKDMLEYAQLSQEGTTTDIISRQAAIDALNHEYRCGDIISQCGIEVAIDIISELPTIQPEPKEGHWIWVAGELMCSECHTIFTDLYPDYDISVACPHCGAKMKGSD